MVHVVGTVHDVADNPDRVERIIVRAVEPRMHGTTYITEESAQFPVVNGVLDFDVLPGACVVAFLRHHGATTYEKLLVPDTAEATFKECRDAADLAEEGDRSALEKVVRQIQDELSKAAPLVDEVRTLSTEVSNDRTAVEGFATAAQQSASKAASSESNAKGHETTAGDYAAVATTAATEAVGAMDRVTEIVDAEYATREYVGQSTAVLTTWTADAVGGRNLLQDSSAEPTELNLTASMHYRDLTEDTLLEVGQEYTFSVIVDKLSDDDHPVRIQVGTGTGKNYTRDITQPSSITLGERTIITFTPTEHHLDGRTHFAWRIRNEQNATTVAYREAKLERGHVATPWTPSPEDAAQSLSEGNPISSLPSPFPAHDPALALRVDNSVGTRVFVGDVMIYGDTGWRSWPELFPTLDASDSLHEIKARRVNDRVEIVINALAMESGSVLSSYLSIGAPSYSFNPAIGTITLNGVLNYMGNHWSSTRLRSQSSAKQGDRVSAVISYTTYSEWPTTLPGTPA